MFYVEALGEPPLFFAWLAIAFAFLVLVYVGAWNAQKYPVPLGYDAQGHIDYAHILLHDHKLPTASEASEYRQPPGYYAVAGVAALLGQKVFGWHEDSPYTSLPETSYRGAQYLNVLFVLATAVLLLSLARMAAPDRPSVWAAALLFFAFLPVVAKTEAMFHPESLNMLLATAAVWLTTRILTRGRIDLRRGIALGVLLVAGLLVRSSALFTLIAVGLGLAIALPRAEGPPATPPETGRGKCRCRSGARRRVARALPHPCSRKRAGAQWRDRAPALRLVERPRRDRTSPKLSRVVFSLPFRPNYLNYALPVTYTEIWGDWIGAFSWSSYSGAPWPPALKVLRDQSSSECCPTALAIGGWLLLLARTLRGRRELMVVALLPLVAVFGYLYRSYLF